MHVENFTYGWLTPVLAYALSVLGSWLGLLCTVRARDSHSRALRGRWLILAAWAMGGTGLWVMHFMAMLGFSVTGMQVRYDLASTLLSWAIAVVVVGIGLFFVGTGTARPSPVRILGAGAFTGAGIAAMHYTGMTAIRLPATISYEPSRVAASVAVAVVLATVALWLSVTLRSGPVVAAAALIMGAAACGMHYTGMSAVKITEVTDDLVTPVRGLIAVTLIGPIVVFVVAVLVALLVALLDRSATDGPFTDATLVLVPAAAHIPGLGGAANSTATGARTSPTAFLSRRER